MKHAEKLPTITRSPALLYTPPQRTQNAPPHAPTPAETWRQSRKNHYHHQPTPSSPAAIHQHTTRPPPATPPQTSPRRRIRTHESPRDARVTQAPTWATNHEQTRAAVSGRDCGWRTGSARGTARRKYAKGRTLTETRENLKEAIEMIIGANHELTPPSCAPLFCHRIYQHSTLAHGCPRIRLGRGTTGTSGDMH
uniref:Uncharacterized protein n=1 Tax=Candidatus Methanogaster sp. ANME-2c ERB4 TaxID=2759911 RepID=A0A7G9Y153_9EURY|nr:hypothetical protein AHFDIGBM_00004 [Methanosarcinales archaeon ANME-2c ERB4]